MTAAIIDGAAVSSRVRDEVAAGVAELRARGGPQPGLATVLVGSDPASQVYVRNKNLATEKAGMRSFHTELPATTPQTELDELIQRLNDDPAVHGILVQSPLPDGLDEQRAFGLVAPHKDVDGFHPWNVGQLALGRPGLRSCTPAGVMELLRDQGVDLVGAEAVVIGRSNIVGKPLSMMLLAAHCTVTITHSRTRDLPGHARRADILVAAIGRPRFVTADMVEAGRRRDRRRHQPHRRRARRRRRLRPGQRDRLGDHARSRRRRPDDDRDAAAQHARGGAAPASAASAAPLGRIAYMWSWWESTRTPGSASSAPTSSGFSCRFQSSSR